MNESPYIQMIPKCRVCQHSLVLNVSLIEYLMGFDEENELLNRITLDDILGTGKISEPKSIIPVAYNYEEKAIAIIGWCEHCGVPRLSQITIQELLNWTDDKGGDNNEEKQRDA